MATIRRGLTIRIYKIRRLGLVAAVAGSASLTIAPGPRAADASETQPDWAGVYGGIEGGYSLGTSSQADTNGLYDSKAYRISGPLAGANLGFNYQFDKWVIGLETELSKAAISGSKGSAFSSEADWAFGVRMRVGYAIGNFMPYIGLGPAYAGLSSSEVFAGAPPIQESEIRSGWIFALGSDYQITPNLFARAEYMYVCYGAAIARNTDSITFMGHYMRFGLDYKFDVAGLKREDVSEAPKAANGAYDWTGFYLGPSIGGSAVGQRTALSVNNIPVGSNSSASAGGIVGFGLQGTVGAEAGANWRVGRFVVGAETDFHLSQLTGAGTTPHLTTTVGGVVGKLTQNDTVGEQGTVRARIGVAFDRWLIYGTAGLAYAELDSDSTFAALGKTINPGIDSTRIGPVVGLGVERAIWGHWTTRLEYMYADFGRYSYSFGAPAPFNSVGSKINFSEQILRVGFNYLFN